jgi:hypothetical protein
MRKYYTGIGSRKAPQEIIELGSDIGVILEEKDYVGRSGNADGMDQSFKAKLKDPNNFQDFLPWPKFNGATTKMQNIPFAAYEMAAKYHPKWQWLKMSVRNLMARNCQQILGENLDNPSEFVLCWTPDGASSGSETSQETGGTGQAIRIASDYNIPIYNFFRKDHREFVLEMIKKDIVDLSKESFDKEKINEFNRK